MNKTNMLKSYLAKSGKKKIYIAEKANVSRPRLDYIFLHPETATVGQAEAISRELSISDSDKMIIFME